MNQTQLGGAVVVRQARFRDADAMRRFLSCLSPRTQYLRFFTRLGAVSETVVRTMITLSPTQLVLLALDGDAVVGHAMAVCMGEQMVDIGIVVADDHRRERIGDRLMRELLDTVSRHGVRYVHSDVLSDNRLVLTWLRRLLPDVRFERSGETVTAVGALAA